MCALDGTQSLMLNSVPCPEKNLKGLVKWLQSSHYLELIELLKTKIGMYYFAVIFVAQWNVEKVLFTPRYHAMK